uniref:Proteasome assembly chaperone 2 n=1 Tax=Ciona savignyi TaxID=51511 RepID=H2Y8M4_CIOSA
MFYMLKDGLNSKPNFESSVLILPAISVGNVGQLACDLIISTLQLQKIGYFCPECFLPLVGSNPFSTANDQKLSLTSEVFHSAEHNITVLQFRSPLVKGKRKEFCEKLTTWAKVEKFSQLIILSSCHAFERKDNEITGSPFRCLISPTFKNLPTQLNWGVFDKKENEELFIPGGGFTKDLYKVCCDSELAVIVLLTYCSEGDNIPDAMLVLDQLNKWKEFCKNENTNWITPISLSHMFGNPVPTGIF